MTDRRRPRVVSTDAFLNLAFHESYEWLLVALVAGLTAVGLTPRLVTELAPDRTRLDRLMDMIPACGVSLHDLSWLRARDPRLNMAFEAGLAVAVARRPAARHRVFLLDEEPHRITRVLSDLRAFDVLVHAGQPRDALRALHGAVAGPRRASLRQILRVHEIVEAAVPAIRREYGSLFRGSGFAALVTLAMRVAADPAASRRRPVRR